MHPCRRQARHRESGTIPECDYRTRSILLTWPLSWFFLSLFPAPTLLHSRTRAQSATIIQRSPSPIRHRPCPSCQSSLQARSRDDPRVWPLSVQMYQTTSPRSGLPPASASPDSSGPRASHAVGYEHLGAVANPLCCQIGPQGSYGSPSLCQTGTRVNAAFALRSVPSGGRTPLVLGAPHAAS
ncbi:hypothetical protein GY45DRAFT_709305 [Cubamyces sp. BRFM 1775]|nr:hypothetical protein GY45DRAFT_709305 [Cubamyces sp. BRFM 1775]